MEINIPRHFDLQRVGNVVYAAASLGSPSMTLAVDRSVFKKTDEEKGKLLTMKKQLGKTKHYKWKEKSIVII